MPNYIDEYRDVQLIKTLTGLLSRYDGKPVKLMEVCGTHTMAISKYGIRSILPNKIQLVSGPGCPVCVTPSFFINAAIELSRKQQIIITTFGDLMRIPGDDSSLIAEKAKGADIRILYSPLDALKIARENPLQKVIWLSVGFETTTPVTALAILKAKEEKLNNFLVLTANKTMPMALRLLSADLSLGIDGFIYPGHVSAITGTGMYEELARDYRIPGVVTGFEPMDILSAIYTLVENSGNNQPIVVNQYRRVVKAQGNLIAIAKLNEIFISSDAIWRGIGLIPDSGMVIREQFAEFDAWKVFDIKIDTNHKEPQGCLCGEILKGLKKPVECPLFAGICTPEKPVGACMVSSEGTCAAYYKYGGLE